VIAGSRRGPEGLFLAAAVLVAGLLGPAFLPVTFAQEKIVTLSFTKELLYNIARDNEGEMTAEIVSRLKGLSPSVEEVKIIRSGGEVSLSYLIRAGDDLDVAFSLTLEKMAFYRMAAAREDIDGMLKIVESAKQREPLILDVAYRYNEHYSIIDLYIDLGPALERREEETKKAADALAPAPAPAPRTPPPPEKPAARPPAADEKTPPPRPVKAEEKKSPLPPGEEPPYLSAVALAKGEEPPLLDGRGGDRPWQKARPFSFEVRGESGNVKVTVAALWGDGKVYFLVQWPDEEPDVEHRPWIWSAEERAYIVGKDVEDALALQFSLAERIGDCMLLGKGYEADVWFWRAARTNPSGYAEDVTLAVSLQRIPKANFYEAKNRRTVWVKESRDDGIPPYRTHVAGAYEGDLVRRYLPREPSGSAADVRARGEWKEGSWTLEFSRALATGAEKDAVFRPGREHYFSVALFNGRERSEHSTSAEHVLRLE